MSAKAAIPGVNNAVEKLQELANRMRSDDFGFRNNDVDHIDQVIDALHELERKRKYMHDMLETETIKSSVLRYQVRVLPGQIRDQIMEAVMSARSSNANVLQDLQQKLEKVNTTIATLETHAQKLELENNHLHPEYEMLKQQHEEIISQLNQRMSDKAIMQIALNETRDTMKQANQEIADMEDSILQLKEELIQERTEARQERKRLKKATDDTTLKEKEQQDQNLIKKRDLDRASERLLESEGVLNTIRKGIRRFEASCAKLEGEERNLTAKLSKQIQQNHEARVKGEELLNEKIKDELETQRKHAELLEKIRQCEIEIENEKKVTDELKSQKEVLTAELKIKEVMKNEHSGKATALDVQLQEAKQALSEKAEEIGLLQTTNTNLQEQIVVLEETHKAVVAQLSKQIEDYAEELKKERKERKEVQIKKDEVSTDLEEVRIESQNFMLEMTKTVQECKLQHEALSSEGTTLQHFLKTEEEQLFYMNQEYVATSQRHEKMLEDMQNRKSTLEATVAILEEDLNEKKRLTEEATPVFRELEKTFVQSTQDYEKMKNEVVVLKSKKSALENEISQILKEKDSAKVPQESLRKYLKEKRVVLIKQIQENCQSIQNIEKQIFTSGCKLRVVIEENQKFKGSCKKLEADLLEVQKMSEKNEEVKKQLLAIIEKEKGELLRRWEEDEVMQKFFAARDIATAEAFGQLFINAEEREIKVDKVTEKLQEELKIITTYLDKITSHQTKESKKEQLVQSQETDTVMAIKKKNTENLHSAIPQICEMGEESQPNTSIGFSQFPDSHFIYQLEDTSDSHFMSKLTLGSSECEEP